MTRALDRMFLIGFERRGGDFVDGLFPTYVGPTAVVRRCAQTDPINPGPERRAAFEAFELAVDDDEHLLADILDVSLWDTEVPKGSPNKRRIFIENRP